MSYSYEVSRVIDAPVETVWAVWTEEKHNKLTPQSLRQRLRNHLGKPYLRIEPQPGASSEMSALRNAWQHARDCWQQLSGEWLQQLKAFDGF
jgi:exodeoxyribonuclease V beta subunit